MTLFQKCVIFFSLFLAYHGVAHAEAETVKHEFKEYRVHLYDDFVAPVKLPVEAVEALRREVLGFASAVRECKSGGGQWFNPMLSRTSVYKITMGEAGCAIELNSLGTWQYECRLTSTNREDLASAIEQRAGTDGVLGDYSAEEKSVFFNPEICDAKKR